MGLLGFGKPRFMKSTVELYRDQLEEVTGNKAEIFRDSSINRKLPHVYTMLFDHYPLEGYLTAFTYGASALQNSKRKELVLQVKSEDKKWGHALGFMANHLREKGVFEVGKILHFGQHIAQGSTMTDFLVGEPSDLLSRDIRISNKTTIHLVQLFPIYKQEIALIGKVGWKTFLAKAEKDCCDVNRSPVRI